jgi:hypothetical protein
MKLVRLGLSLKRRSPMLRLALLLFYLFADSSTHDKQGGSLDPLGVNPPPPPTVDAGAGNDPDGIHLDAGAGNDPNG